MTQLEDDVAALRQQVDLQMAQSSSQMAEINDLRTKMAEFQSHYANSGAQQAACAPDMPAPTAETEGRSFAGLARELQRNPVILKKLAMKPAIKPVVGASLANKHVKAVTTSRIVNIFVSRLHPETKSAELIDSVHSVKGELIVQDIVCEKLNSKFESLYCSYHVAIRVDSVDMKQAIDTFMSASSWPSGVFVKRFFPKKSHGSTE